MDRQGNWTGGNIPGVTSQDTAVFGAALTGGTATVTLDNRAYLSSLALSATGANSYTINPSNGSTLTLSNSTGTATIGNNGGNNTIAAPILLGSNLSVSTSAGSILNLVGGISANGGGDSVSFSGGGELILSGANSYTGGSTVLSGTLDLANAAALPGMGVLTVGGGAAVVSVASYGIEALPGATSPLVAGAISSVPEPSTLLLMIVGAVGLAARVWRRNWFQ